MAPVTDLLRKAAIFKDLDEDELNRELAHKVLGACVRLLSFRLRSTNDSLWSFLAMSMF
jgi:hypothetical protein